MCAVAAANPSLPAASPVGPGERIDRLGCVYDKVTAVEQSFVGNRIGSPPPDLGSFRRIRQPKEGVIVFTLITFGGLRLIRPDSTLAEVPTHRAQAFLLFLALHQGRAVHRETICAALWPGSSEASARAQLRKSLWRVKSAAGTDQDGSPLICNEYQIGLNPARIWVDLWQFTDAMRGLELKADATLNIEDAKVLLHALDLNRDAFGRGLFDDWLLIEHHCPICVAATSCQGLCHSELELFRAALGPEVTVAREQHLLSGDTRCAYRISVRPLR